MRLNMITVDRAPQPSYLPGTLESLTAGDWNPAEMPLTLIVGNDKQEYVRHLGYNVLPWDGPPFETRWISFVDNYIRALRHGDGDVVVCEDDLYFTPHWASKLQAALEEIRRKLDRFVLALYAPRHPGLAWFRRGKHYRAYKPTRFFGTQAMYFPASVRAELADFMEANRRRRPGDLLIGEWCRQPHNPDLYALSGSVVQHVGSVSTGLGSGQHRAWNLLS